MADAGFARCSSSSTARTFSISWAGSKEALPIGTWTLPTWSVRYSTRPALNSLTALADVGGHRSGLGVRHEATRAEHPAEATDLGHQVRRGDRDVEVEEPSSRLGRPGRRRRRRPRRPPAPRRPPHPPRRRRPAPSGRSRRAARASRARSGRPCAGRPRAGRPAPRSRRTWPWRALHEVDGLGERRRASRGRPCSNASRVLACRVGIIRFLLASLGRSAGDRDAHRAGGARDLALGRLEVVGVEVGQLDLGDLGELGVGDRARPARGREVAAPFSSPAASRSSTGVGGVFRRR